VRISFPDSITCGSEGQGPGTSSSPRERAGWSRGLWLLVCAGCVVVVVSDVCMVACACGMWLVVWREQHVRRYAG
jgi:hypothetical protein